MTKEDEVEDCVKVLLDSNTSLEEKKEAFKDYYVPNMRAAKGAGFGEQEAEKQIIGDLLKHLKDGPSEQQKRLVETLKKISGEISKSVQEEKNRRKKRRKEKKEKLNKLKKGTPIIINRRGQEELVFFLDMKRKNFEFEYPDGRRYKVDALTFDHVHEGKTPTRLEEEERRERNLVRKLSGRYSEQAREEIIDRGVEMIPALRDELAAALTRVEEAPTGFSEGALRDSLGPVKKVNPRDQALLKRIPKVIAVIAKGGCEDEVTRLVKKHPNQEVHTHCLKDMKTRE